MPFSWPRRLEFVLDPQPIVGYKVDKHPSYGHMLELKKIGPTEGKYSQGIVKEPTLEHTFQGAILISI